jgi:hypothetical protein
VLTSWAQTRWKFADSSQNKKCTVLHAHGCAHARVRADQFKK